MPKSENIVSYDPDNVDWDDDDEIYIASGHIPGYGFFQCHSPYFEACTNEYMEFARGIRDECIDYGFVDLDHETYWDLPEYETRPVPPDDDFGFGAEQEDLEYF